ncbi:MAG: CDP-alcohol phosphatidyltransferase family protein [Sandaracinus sp.]|nr:CDP-alcohol phosphatidyltransferase family protein [Sandaracinus sp.]
MQELALATPEAAPEAAATAETVTAKPAAIVVGVGDVAVYGLDGAERLRRQLRRAGLTEVQHTTDGSFDAVQADTVVVLRADHAFEEPLFPDLVKRNGIALLAEDSGRPAALHVSARDAAKAVRLLLDGGDVPEDLEVTALDASGLSGSYNKQLRKRATFYVLRVTKENRGALEKRIFAGSYKGVTDIVSKFVWPFPARHVTSFLSRFGVTPNMVTTVGFVLVLVAFWCFWQGRYAEGLIAGWIMTFLDTVDGKLARVTMTSSRFGDIFDHSIDLIHPPFWYWAWIHGLGPEANADPASDVLFAVILAGYVLQRLQEGFFIKVFKIEMHIWRPFDSYFRTITARRNPNMVILTVLLLAGRPDVGIYAVGVWTAACLVIHTLQIVQAGWVRRSGAPIRSWLAG